MLRLSSMVLVGLLGWGLACDAVRAQVRELGLEEAIAVAMERNPNALAAQRRLPVAQAEILVAGAVPNPSMRFDGEFVGESSKVALPVVEQPFELGGKRGARLAVADAQVALTRAQIAQVLTEVRAQVRRAYAELLVSRADAEALAQAAGNASRLAGIAGERVRLGDVPELDLIRARQEEAQADNELQLGRTRQRTAEIALNALLGRDVEAPIALPPVPQFALRVEKHVYLPGDPGDPKESGRKLQALLGLALANRLDLRAVEQRIALARAERRLAEAARVPDLTLGAGPLFEQQTVGIVAAVGISLPVWYRQEGQIARTEATLEQLDSERAALTKQIEAEVRSAYLRVLAARGQQGVYARSLLPGAQETAQISQIAYERGKADLTVPIAAQTALAQTRRRYHQALFDREAALADLERSVGIALNE